MQWLRHTSTMVFTRLVDATLSIAQSKHTPTSLQDTSHVTVSNFNARTSTRSYDKASSPPHHSNNSHNVDGSITNAASPGALSTQQEAQD